MEFEWNSKKARSNFNKHGISFDEASTVFEDTLATVYEDPDHSVEERRFLMIGLSSKGQLLHIAFADRGERIRIVNARKVTKKEKRLYEEEER